MANPFTTGPFNCCTCPEPPDYDPDVDDPLATYINLCDCPIVSIECVSESKTATLCGYNEFVASSPPSRYLKETVNGSGSYTFTGVSCEAATGSKSSSGNASQSGTREYDLSGGICTPPATNSFSYSGTYSSCGVSCSYNGIATGWPVAVYYGLLSNCTSVRSSNSYSDVDTATVRTRSIDPGWQPNIGDWSVSGTLTFTLSIPDTEVNALARETATAGTSCSSIYQLRTTSFSFTQRTATYTATASNLVIGVQYEGCVRIRRREAYSGTEPVDADMAWYDVEPDTIATFTAIDTEEEIATDVALPNVQGYEYEVVGAYVWPASAGCDCPTSYVAP